jgi:hypothetical protein
MFSENEKDSISDQNHITITESEFRALRFLNSNFKYHLNHTRYILKST